MKQLLQHLDSGRTELADVLIPAATERHVVVEARASVISPGTERMLVEFARASLLDKARQQPEKVARVLDKIRADGLVPTLEAVRSQLAAPLAMGYCQAGIVVDVGRAVAGFAAGDRVATNGPHAEYTRVPATLAAKIPDSVSFETAAFTPLAAIGLQGIRVAKIEIGETVVVFGLGLIGLLTVQLLRAHGCNVIGIDRARARLDTGVACGAKVIEAGDDAPDVVRALTAGRGADAVLLTLASKDSAPVHQAADMSRARGRIILVGTAGLELAREDFYKKELAFTVSCSYGPGRYDPAYTEGGQDYPLSYVRWTAQRNFEAVLALMADGRLDLEPLVSHRIPFERATEAVDLLTSDRPSLGVVLSYSDRGGVVASRESRTMRITAHRPANGGGVAVIGTGNFAVRIVLPLLSRAGADIRAVVSSGGPGATLVAKKFGALVATTDLDHVLADPDVASVCILTRHDSHASLVTRALNAGKHVFVEKPLALEETHLDEIAEAAAHSGRMLMVGFNRRFAPLALALRTETSTRAGPVALVITVNAGEIARDHWTQNTAIGGGRIVGEACHFIDLARFLVGASIHDLSVTSARNATGHVVDDIAHLLLSFTDGSTAAIHYLANGDRSFPKERIEAFVDGAIYRIDNWRRLDRFGRSGAGLGWRRRAAKGHAEEIDAWLDAVRRGGPSPIPLDEILEASRWAIRAGALARGMRE